jgi:spermidine synthase
MTQVLTESSANTSAEASTEAARLICGVSLTSFSALLLELSLTRLFSVILFYHFAFLAISLALLGLGAGGVFAYVNRSRLARFQTHSLGAACCGLNAVATLGMLLLVLHIPVGLQLDVVNALKLTAIYFSSMIAFFFTGLLFSTLFARESRRIGLLYGADLMGGALACFAVVPLLNWLGGPNVVLFAGAIMAFASAVWSLGASGRRRALILAAGLLLLIGANRLGSFIDVIYAKGVRLDRVAKVEFVRWNALARVEVDQKPDHSKWIVLDADANSALVNVDPHSWRRAWGKDLMSAPPALANLLRPRGEYAIIGPGGGIDVLRAVVSGSRHVEGIEINPIIANTIMRGRYADYSYDLYRLPQVHITVGDGRSFIRSTRQRFDVVEMTLVDTWASTAAGAMALSENYLYTTEAFLQYFQHLKTDGIVAVTRWEFQEPREALRVVSVEVEALHRLGSPTPAGNFIVVSEGPLNEDGRPVVVLAKKSPFTRQEESEVQAHVAAHPDLTVLYSPSAGVSNAFGQMIAGNDPAGFARNYPYDVTPASDDSPFFFFTLKAGKALKPGAALRRGMDWKINLGVAVLGMVTLISVAAVLLFLILPLSRPAIAKRGALLPLLYFVAVGLGYILVEISFVQRFVLFLGNPTYALTVVVFLLLLSSGLGSLASRHWQVRPGSLLLPPVFIASLVLAFALLLPRLNAAVGAAFSLKLLMTAGMLIPLGFLMGIPFPTGLRALSAGGSAAQGEHRKPDRQVHPAASFTDNTVEWAWALNAGASVLGSDLAVVTAIHFGLKMTLAFGGVAYLLACMLAGRFRLAGDC